MRPTPPLTRKLTRLRLTTKQAANKGGYYKGTGTGAMGWHTKHGGYVIDWAKVRTYVVPAELGDCKLSPFVTQKITEKEARMQNLAYRAQRMMGGEYLEQWKEENGID
ncbi:MAG: hypothetical protein Q9164_000400 [Protoblastenia rupestris]